MIKNDTVSVWQLSLFELNRKMIVTGVLVKNNTVLTDLSTGSWNHMSSIARSYFVAPYANREVIAVSSTGKIKTTTNKNGAFFFEADLPFSRGFSLTIEGNRELIVAAGSLDEFYNSKKTRLSVISDIDDTIMVSHTRQRLRSIFTTLFRPYHKRAAIRFTQKLFESLKVENPNHFYVSRSEVNLYPLISKFIRHNKLPRGPLFLTPLLSLRELIANNKEPDFKYRSIEWLIAHSPEKEFILVGDDSQHDIDIYTRIGKRFNTQIRSIYIRQTNSKINTEKSSRWKELNDSVPSAIYFKKDEIFTNR